jgi:hypothetical protein
LDILDLGRETPLLQGWAIVDNDGNNDWNDVELSLVTGRPVSFIQNLYAPYHTQKPELPLAIANFAEARSYESGSSHDEEFAAFGKWKRLKPSGRGTQEIRWRGFRGQGPKIPHGIGILEVGTGVALLGVNEVGKFDRVPDKEYGCVVSHKVVVAFPGIQFNRRKLLLFIIRTIINNRSKKTRQWRPLFRFLPSPSAEPFSRN